MAILIRKDIRRAKKRLLFCSLLKNIYATNFTPATYRTIFFIGKGMHISEELFLLLLLLLLLSNDCQGDV